MLLLQFYKHQEQGGDIYHRASLKKIFFLVLKNQCCKECKECHRPTDNLSEESVIKHNKFLNKVNDHQIIRHSSNKAMKIYPK